MNPLAVPLLAESGSVEFQLRETSMPYLRAERYRLDSLPQDNPIKGALRRRVMGEQAMLSELRMDQGCAVTPHAHANEQFVVLLSGKVRFSVTEIGNRDPREITLEPGDVMYLPSNVLHGALCLEDSRALEIFSPVSETTGIDK